MVSQFRQDVYEDKDMERGLTIFRSGRPPALAQEGIEVFVGHFL